MARRVLFLLLLLALAVTPGLGRPVASPRSSCVDDFEGLLEHLSENGFLASARNDPESCGDALRFCENNGQAGQFARSYCCKTCAGDSSGGSGSDTNKGNNINSSSSSNNNGNGSFPISSILPPRDKPLDLFLLGGQSECKGSAQSAQLFGAGKSKYQELQDSIDGVWFAGYRGTAGPGQFLIRPMSAKVDRGTFGPEVSFGERIYAATGGARNVMIVKYCVGGTNVRSHWNPDKAANSWNEQQDDGTSAWLESKTEFETKDLIKSHQFVNSIYTVRRTEEALDAAGISYSWAGIVWVQGNADSMPIGDQPVWKTFGENTVRVWDGFREQLGSNVPIIDNGSNNQNQLKSGKEYAISLVEGGLAYNVEHGVTASDDTGTCKLGPKNPCIGASGWFLDGRIFDLFGFDPKMFDDPSIDTAGKEGNRFNWFVDYPNNVHSAYDGMVLNGRMLANAYLRQFRDPSEYDLTPYSATDVEAKFPFVRCPDGVVASPNNICWIDYRSGVPTLAPATFPLIPTAAPPPPDTARPTGMPRPTGFPSAPTAPPAVVAVTPDTARPTGLPTAPTAATLPRIDGGTTPAAPPVLRPTVILEPAETLPQSGDAGGDAVRADLQVLDAAASDEETDVLTSGLRASSSAPLSGSWMVRIAAVGIAALAQLSLQLP
eukprot:CAMPEP_0197186780 /NCGR_PEP_ID=MMETSP1423-20130617/14600_1 /TAXON_ID=476441 /ORGANISM="Pseudo-nitzschia heimii, Strain UNC1101" /LENGTH=660 /DNA_ID=CAMNT_0042638187 /DNA_START=209 /DNA_END=2191 /DNA_ORIENTATION=-